MTHCQKPDDVGRYKGYEVKRSTTALNEVMHACNKQKDGYRVVDAECVHNPLHRICIASLARLANPAPCPPPKKRMQGHDGLNEINAPTKDNTPTRLNLS